MMKDWNQYGAELVSTLGRIGAVSPDLLKLMTSSPRRRRPSASSTRRPAS